jgi:hypothetical protein
VSGTLFIEGQGWRRAQLRGLCSFRLHATLGFPCASLDIKCDGVATRGLCGSAALSCGKALPFRACTYPTKRFWRGCASPLEAQPQPQANI